MANNTGHGSLMYLAGPSSETVGLISAGHGQKTWAVDLNQGQLYPPGDIWQWLQMGFGCHNWRGEGVTDIYWVEVREDTQHLKWTAPPPTRNYLAPNVSSVTVGQHYCRCWLALS
jgi:hypothetical protein